MLPIDVACNLLRILNEDLNKVDAGNYSGLMLAAQVLVKEVYIGLDKTRSGSPPEVAQKEIIIACMDFADRWNEWLVVHSGRVFKHRCTRIFHEFILRHFKGLIKAWRIWLIDLKK